MTIDKIHEYLNFIINKEQGKWYTPPQIDSIIHTGSLETFNTFYTPENKNQPIHSALHPFRKTMQFLAADFTGNILNCPSDYVYATSIMVRVYNNKRGATEDNTVVLYREDEWEDAKASQVVPATTSKPVALEVGKTPLGIGQIEFSPTGSYNGTLRYLKIPVKPVFVYNQVGRVITHNPTTSTQLEWADPYVNMVMLKALSSIGINLMAKEIVDYVDGKVNTSLNTPNKV